MPVMTPPNRNVVERIQRALVDPPRCVYCGWPTLPNETACFAHRDLPALDRADVVRLRLSGRAPSRKALDSVSADRWTAAANAKAEKYKAAS